MHRLATLLLACSFSGAVHAADFLDDPKKICGHFESLGMKAQMQWTEARAGAGYFCQYADEFSGSTTHVRGAKAYLDLKGKWVGVGLSIQTFGGQLVKAELADAVVAYVERFNAAHGVATPPGLRDLLVAETAKTIVHGGLEIANMDPKLWGSHSVLGITMRRQATAADIARVGTSITPQEKAQVADVNRKLEARCDAAVAASGHAANPAALKRKTTPLSASRILVELSGDAGSYVCQVCDDADPKVNCGTMGLMLSFRGNDGANVMLPAEIERKCVYTLQKEVMADDAGVFIDHELVARITTREIPNDKRYVYEHELDGLRYRCVVRKSDLSFTLEREAGAGEWRGLVGGIMP